MPSVELSITDGGSPYRRGVPQDVSVSTKPRGGNAAGAIGTVSAFVLLLYCCFGIARITISIWLAHFSGDGFPYWSTDGRSRRLGEIQQGSSRVGDSEGVLPFGR